MVHVPAAPLHRLLHIAVALGLAASMLPMVAGPALAQEDAIPEPYWVSWRPGR